MSEEKVIRTIGGGAAFPSLLTKLDIATNRAVAVSSESPLPINSSAIDDFYLEIAKGNIPGHKEYSIPGLKDGISTTLLDDVSEIPGITTIPVPGGIQLEVVSSSNTDSDSGGSNPQSTGVRSMSIHYLDANGLEQEEIVTMDGTNPVNTAATDITNVQWMHTKTAGSGGVAAGNISLRDTGGTITYEYFIAGGNQSLSARYTVPSNKTGYIVGWQASASVKAVDFFLLATVDRFDRSLLDVFVYQDVILLDIVSSGWIPFEVHKRIPAGGTVKIAAKSITSGGNGGAQFDIMLIDN